MIHAARHRSALYGLAGAFDLAATVRPADTQVAATAPVSAPVLAVSQAQSKLAPLAQAAVTPRLVLAPGTIPAATYQDSSLPPTAMPLGPAPSFSAPRLISPPRLLPIADASGITRASTEVSTAHSDALDPTAFLSRGVNAFNPAERPRELPGPIDGSGGPTPEQMQSRTFIVEAGAGVRPQASVPAWAYGLAAVAVVGGAFFVLTRRR